jgi:hypothetical protein
MIYLFKKHPESGLSSHHEIGGRTFYSDDKGAIIMIGKTKYIIVRVDSATHVTIRPCYWHEILKNNLKRFWSKIADALDC